MVRLPFNLSFSHVVTNDIFRYLSGRCGYISRGPTEATTVLIFRDKFHGISAIYYLVSMDPHFFANNLFIAVFCITHLYTYCYMYCPFSVLY